MQNTFHNSVKASELIAVRRQIHAWPEPGWAEFMSTARVAKELTDLGFQVFLGKEVINPQFIRGCSKKQVEEGLAAAQEKGIDPELLEKMGGITGCVGLFDSGRPGPTIACRFELDCVPVTETLSDEHIPTKEGFMSQRKGYMHACGHDGHQAVGLGLARWLVENKEALCGRVKLLFQPAEEGVRGARPMAESGIVDDVDILFCAHLGCDIPSGVVVAAPEKFLCTTKLDFKFKGSASHAGMQPEVGHNALMAASTASLILMGLPRHGEGMTRVNVGYMRAGEGRNVIASTAEMQVEVRGENEKINNFMTQEAIHRVEGAGMSFGVEVTHEIMGEAVDFIPDDEVTELVMDCAASAEGVVRVDRTMNFNGSDDATVLIKKVQSHGGKAAYFVVGSDLKAGHHQSCFDFEEKHLSTMFDIYTSLLARQLGK